jgi:hypothetical protein
MQVGRRIDIILGSNQPLASGHLMTVDQRPTAKRLEQSNRVRSGIADAHRFDLENFRFIENSNFSIQNSEETVLL